MAAEPFFSPLGLLLQELIRGQKWSRGCLGAQSRSPTALGRHRERARTLNLELDLLVTFCVSALGKTDPKRDVCRGFVLKCKTSNRIFQFQPLEACSAPKWSRAPNPKMKARWSFTPSSTEDDDATRVREKRRLLPLSPRTCCRGKNLQKLHNGWVKWGQTF